MDLYKSMCVAPCKYSNVNSSEDQIDAAIQQHHINILKSIFYGISFLFAKITQYNFQPDDKNIEWRTNQKKKIFPKMH